MTLPTEAREIADILMRGGIIGDDSDPEMEPLTGGVSSDIWKVSTPDGPICVKRALAKLKVEDDWRAPVERNAYEAAWMRTVKGISDSAAPTVLFEDTESGLFAMPYLTAQRYPLWKGLLRDGHAELPHADAVGRALGKIHAATGGDADIAAAFPTDEIFYAIRLEPYLVATARRHPALAERLNELAEITASHHVALVHGDVSPKNILIGPDGPVFLDAECAWYGDPAFDLAFCLNHLLLKCLWTPSARSAFLACFNSLVASYEMATQKMSDRDIVRRTAHLLPGLFLARVDGKSPVEYITDEAQKDLVRSVATSFLTTPAEHPIDIAAAWHDTLEKNA